MAKHPSTIPAPSRTDALTNGVLEGMRKHPRQLSPVWFYDELGSFLFDSICELPEYYLTRTESQIMHSHAADMAHHIGPDAAIIEFGSGTSTKTRLLLNHLEKPAAYVPVDIARDHLLTAASAIQRDYSTLRVIPICADFTQPFDLPASVYAARRRAVYFPGSTLGNFAPEQAQELLRRMRQIIGANGAVLIGIDLKKDPRILERAYNDRAGVTAEFNVNALRHLNRELGTDFDLDAFEHTAVWVEDRSRIEMHLISKRDQDVRIGDETVHIEKGEHLTTEFCHKYTLETFADLAATAGLSVSRVWMDPERKFSVQLLEPRSLQ
jgi:L-histidine Nalpha-methyltransferase